MIRLHDLGRGSSVSLLDGSLQRSGNGRLTVRADGRTWNHIDEELDDSETVHLAVGLSGFVALGERSHVLLGLGGSLGAIARLDLPGYDPGGLHRVVIHVIDDDRVLVETEVGVSLVHLGRGVLWEHVHADVTVRVNSVADGLVHLVGERAQERIALSDGSHRGSDPND